MIHEFVQKMKSNKSLNKEFFSLQTLCIALGIKKVFGTIEISRLIRNVQFFKRTFFCKFNNIKCKYG